MKNLLRKLHVSGNHEGHQVDAGLIIEGRSFHDGSSHGGGGGGSGGLLSSGAKEPISGGEEGATTTTTNTTSSSALSGSPPSTGTGSGTGTGPAMATGDSTKPSGLTTFLRGVKDSVGRVKDNDKLSNPITNAIGQLRHRLDSSGRMGSGGGSGGDDLSSAAGSRRMQSPPGSFKRETAAASPPGSLKSRGHSVLGRSVEHKDAHALEEPQNEEEYQVQMAMALSVSGNYQSESGPGTVEKEQIKAAKRMSFGGGAAAGANSDADVVSYKYWAVNKVEYSDVIPDGFYDVFGMNRDSYMSETMPLLSDLQRMPVSDTLKIEVVLVNRELDLALVALETKAAEVAAKDEAEHDGYSRIALAQKIAYIVAEQMGGLVASEDDMLLRWQKASWDVKRSIQNVVLTLGSLKIGLTRHRALLFKVLADRVGLPCQLVKGRDYRGVEEEGAVNIMKVDDSREYMIDLMAAPGVLIPADKGETEASPKSIKTELSSSLVSSAQSSPSGSTRSCRSDAGAAAAAAVAAVGAGAGAGAGADKERKDVGIQKESGAGPEISVPAPKLDVRYHSEHMEPEELDKNSPRQHSGKLNNRAIFRSPSWTEGIGVPHVERQVKEIPNDITANVSQLVMAAKENPQIAQKLQDVLFDSGILPDFEPQQPQVSPVEERITEDEKQGVQERKQLIRRKSNVGSGKPPLGSVRGISQLATDDSQLAKDRLQRLHSVEGLGDRRPLLQPAANFTPVIPVDIAAEIPPVVAVPASLPMSIPAISAIPAFPAIPVAIPVALPGISALASASNAENSAGFIGTVPVAAAAAAAATAAVVASSMAAAAARADGGGDPKMEVPIAAAATATAAVVAATSAVAGRKADSVNSSPANSQPGSASGVAEVKVEEHGREEGGSDGTNRPSGDRKSAASVSTPGNSHRAVTNSGDGLDGEVSVEEERNSEDMSGRQRRYDAVLADVAEWEIPWEDIVVGDRIGIGSYGEVYRGDWHGSEVAVKKFLDQDLSGYALDEFRSEVRIMRRLRHPNVVLFMGAITRPPHLSIVTEFLPRGSLYRLIHRPNNQLDERRRLRMALDVAKGMNYLHSSNPPIVHRDLKSPNLLVDKNWVVKVCDFGLSRMKHATFLSSKSTAGTPEWMAPEMLRSEPSNEKCDVYSFGVILWELATMKQPWGGMNPMQVVGAVGFQYRRLEIPSEMDPGLASIIKECWHDNPNLRPSFSQLMAALRPLQRPLSASQQAETSKQGQTSQGSVIQPKPGSGQQSSS